MRLLRRCRGRCGVRWRPPRDAVGALGESDGARPTTLSRSYFRGPIDAASRRRWCRCRLPVSVPARARGDAVAAGVVVPSMSSTIRPTEVRRPDHGRPGQGRCTHRIGKRKSRLIHLLRGRYWVTERARRGEIPCRACRPQGRLSALRPRGVARPPRRWPNRERRPGQRRLAQAPADDAVRDRTEPPNPLARPPGS